MTEIIFGRYTREQLEDQYNARATVPDHEEIFKHWRARSEDYRQSCSCRLDIPYGSGKRETLDLFLPDRPHDAPVLAFIHGGYWRAMDKSMFSFLAEGIVERGGLVAFVNYGLCPAVTMDDIVQQMKGACEWLWRNCSDYGGNSENLHVSGHSAGGHLTAMLLAMDWATVTSDLPSDLVKSGIAVSGLFELKPMLYLQLNSDLRMDEETARRNSPAFLNPKSGTSVSIVVGGAESDEFRRQSADFAKNWRDKGARADYIELADLNHFTIIDQMKHRNKSLTSIILSHMGLAQ